MDNIWTCHCNRNKPERYSTKMHEVFYCPVCFFHEIKRIECDHEQKDFVRVLIANGTYQLRTICGFCKLLLGKAYKFDTVEDFNAVPILPKDYSPPNSWEERSKIDKRLNDREKEYLSQKRRIEYNQYLDTDKWKLIRSKALERDNYLCQSCRKNNAVDVHHLTYDFKGNEPLFTLVSVCRFCHDEIHKMLKGENSEDIHAG